MRAKTSRPRRSNRGVRAGMPPTNLGRSRVAASGRRSPARGRFRLTLQVMSAPPDRVILRNARQHNLKGITVELPRRALTVITGPSGSGKSSLAFDTLYAEGQRRYIESLSTYAKQFLERMPKPLVDSLEGLSPAVAIEQKNPTTSSRSTVGTATEIYDFLRLLWARVGTPYCLHCGSVVKVDTVEEVVDDILGATGTLQQVAGEQSEAVLVTFPLPDSAHRPDVDAAAQLVAAGFVRAQVDGVLLRLDEREAESRVRGGRDVLVIVNRLAPSDRNRGRLADAVATAFAEGEGVAVALDNGRRRRFSSHPTCSACGRAGPALTPALFSFNNPRGACPGCNGFGAVLEYDESLIVPESGMTLAQGAIDPWTKPRYEGRRRLLRETARARGIPANTPWRDLDARQRHFLLHGGTGGGRYVGVFPFLERLESKRYKQYIRVFLRQYQLAKTCPACSGARLKPEALAVQVGRRTIAEVAALTAAELQRWIGELTLTPFQQAVARHLLEELTARVSFVVDVGLGYLTIDRQTRTLSGGEAHRDPVRPRRADQRPAPERRAAPARPAAPPRDSRQHRRRGGARPGRHGRRRLHGGAGSRERDRGGIARLSGTGRRGEIGRHPHRPVSLGGEADQRAVGAAPRPALAHAARGPAAQPQERGRPDSPACARRRHRRVGLGQVHPGARRPVPPAGAPAPGRAQRQGAPGRAGGRGRGARGLGGHRRRRPDRPIADRPHAAVQPRHLREGIRRAATAVRRPAPRPRAALHREHVLLQRPGRALRGV